MSIISLSCPTPGCYQNYQCDPEFLNKIVAVAFVEKSSAGDLDKSSKEAWMTSLFELYLLGKAYIIFNTSGEKPRPETATVAGRGMQTTKALAKTHSVNITDMQGVVQSNVVWYNQMLSTSQKYDFYYFTPERIWDASGNYVTVIGDPVVTAELNTYQTAEVGIQWVSKANPLPYDFDTDIFLEGLFFEIVDQITGGTPETQFTFPNASPLDTNWTAVLNQSGLPSQTVTWGLQAGESQIPAGMTINASTGFLDVLESTPQGVYDLVVTVTNDAGCVFGSLNITVTVPEFNP